MTYMSLLKYPISIWVIGREQCVGIGTCTWLTGQSLISGPSHVCLSYILMKPSNQIKMLQDVPPIFVAI